MIDIIDYSNKVPKTNSVDIILILLIV